MTSERIKHKSQQCFSVDGVVFAVAVVHVAAALVKTTAAMYESVHGCHTSISKIDHQAAERIVDRISRPRYAALVPTSMLNLFLYSVPLRAVIKTYTTCFARSNNVN